MRPGRFTDPVFGNLWLSSRMPVSPPREERHVSTRHHRLVAVLSLLLLAPATARAAAPTTAPSTEAPHTRKQDVVYGRKHGVALTLDVFTPKKPPNGAAAIFVV